MHIGNILKFKHKTAITDMGLCKPANYNALKNINNNIYGVLPYVAPEILRGQNYTKAADIYSFGIIMYEVISGLRPYHYTSHENLALGICQGLRPRFNIKVPQLIVRLIKSCLDSDPLKRPKAREIEIILNIWICKPSDKQTVELRTQIEEADNINNNSPKVAGETSKFRQLAKSKLFKQFYQKYLKLENCEIFCRWLNLYRFYQFLQLYLHIVSHFINHVTLRSIFAILQLIFINHMIFWSINKLQIYYLIFIWFSVKKSTF